MGIPRCNQVTPIGCLANQCPDSQGCLCVNVRSGSAKKEFCLGSQAHAGYVFIQFLQSKTELKSQPKIFEMFE